MGGADFWAFCANWPGDWGRIKELGLRFNFFVTSVTSNCLCKNLEGAGFPFQVESRVSTPHIQDLAFLRENRCKKLASRCLTNLANRKAAGLTFRGLHLPPKETRTRPSVLRASNSGATSFRKDARW